MSSSGESDNEVSITSLTKENEQLKQRIKDLRKRNNDVENGNRSAVESVKKENDRLSKENKHLQSENQEQYDLIGRLQEDLHIKATECERFQKELKSLKEFNTNQSHEITELHKLVGPREHKRSTSEIKEKDEIIASLKRDLTHSQETYKRSQSEFKRVSLLQYDINKQNLALQDELQDRKNEIDRIMSEVEPMQEERAQLLDMYDVLREFFNVSLDLSPNALRDVISDWTLDQHGPITGLRPAKNRVISLEDELQDGDETDDNEELEELEEAEEAEEDDYVEGNEAKSNDHTEREGEEKPSDEQAPGDKEVPDSNVTIIRLEPEGLQESQDEQTQDLQDDLQKAPVEPGQTPTKAEQAPVEPGQTQAEPEKTQADPEQAPADPGQTQAEPVKTQAEPEQVKTEQEQTKPEPEQPKQLQKQLRNPPKQRHTGDGRPAQTRWPAITLLTVDGRHFQIALAIIMIGFLYLISALDERRTWLAANDITRQYLSSIRDGGSMWQSLMNMRFITEARFDFEQLMGFERGLLG